MLNTYAVYHYYIGRTGVPVFKTLNTVTSTIFNIGTQFLIMGPLKLNFQFHTVSTLLNFRNNSILKIYSILIIQFN